MSNIKESAADIYKMLGEGKLLDAFDKYYAENVVMEEVGQTPREGKAVNRAYEEAFLGSIVEFHGMGVDSIAVDEENGIVQVQNWMEITHKEYGRVKFDQVAVQKWENGVIVHEKFYHQ